MKLATLFKLVGILLLLSGGAAQAAPKIYVIDSARSDLTFKVRHFMFTATGHFLTLSGSLALDEKKPEDSKVNAVIQLGTVDTANKERDTHLQSADFFNVAKFPVAAFASTGVKQTSPTTADVTGTLTLHGVSHEIPLNVTLVEKLTDPSGKTRTRWQASGTLLRSDYALNWAKPVEALKVIGNEVKIEIVLEAVEK